MFRKPTIDQNRTNASALLSVPLAPARHATDSRDAGRTGLWLCPGPSGVQGRHSHVFGRSLCPEMENLLTPYSMMVKLQNKFHFFISSRNKHLD
jgi:hypothetical protein